MADEHLTRADGTYLSKFHELLATGRMLEPTDDEKAAVDALIESARELATPRPPADLAWIDRLDDTQARQLACDLVQSLHENFLLGRTRRLDALVDQWKARVENGA